MAAAYKFEVQRYRLGSEKEGEVNDEEVTVAMMADLQEEQDKESAVCPKAHFLSIISASGGAF